jgi:putative MATE family efflux protein
MANIQEKYDLTQGVIWKKLLRFFLPIVIGTLFQQLYNTVDAIVVGRFVGVKALAAVGGSAAVILNLLIGFFIGLSVGATVIIAQYFGANDSKNIFKAVHTSIAFCLVTGAVLTVVGVLITPWSLRVVHNPAEIMGLSETYLRIFFYGTIPVMIFNMGSGILRAVGDSQRPLYYLMFCCGMNIGLDLLFVAVFKMGVAGAAWATVISQLFSAVLILLRLCRTQELYKLTLRKIRFYPGMLKNMLRIGIPTGIESVTYSVSNLIIQAGINHFGTTVVAASNASSKVDGIYWAIMQAFGVAITAFVGQNFGAGKYDRMKQSVRVTMKIAHGRDDCALGGNPAFRQILPHALYRRSPGDSPRACRFSATLRRFISSGRLSRFSPTPSGAPATPPSPW